MDIEVNSEEIHMSEDEAMAEMLNENMEFSVENMSSEDALSLMESENAEAENLDNLNSLPDKKQTNQILKVVEKTDLLMADFYKQLEVIDEKFNEYSKIFFNKANEIANSIKTPNKEDDKLVLINLAVGVGIKGVGAIWQSVQTEIQLKRIVQIFAHEAAEKMVYVGMLIDWLDTASEIAFERLLDVTDIDVLLEYLNIYRGLDLSFRLANYLYSVYDASLTGNFTHMAYPTLYDVNKSLISILAHLETKSTDSEQLEANRNGLKKVAARINSVMSGTTELPELIDVLIASDNQLMATAVEMGMPDPNSYEENEDIFEQDSHFPFENLSMIPESIDYVTDFTSLQRKRPKLRSVLL